MSDPLRNRLRLWLRTERALGLTSVVASGPMAELSAPAVEPEWDHAEVQEAYAEPAPAVRRPAPTAPQPAAASPDALFGAPSAPPPPAAAEPFTGETLPSDEKRRLLQVLDETEVTGCTRCPLSQTRKNTVFGEGDADAQVMFVGEGPGATEDATGRPFVGRAGELLDKMIGAMGLRRDQTYIANVVKCRAFTAGPPAKDRAPTPDEVAACTPYLHRQIEIIRPKVIVTLGLPASRHLLDTKESMGRLRGRWHDWRGTRVMPTWHPSYLLRRQTEGDVEPKRQAWSDLQQVMAELGLPGAKSRT